MHRLACVLVGCLGVAAAGAPAGAAVLIPVISVPNSSVTTVFGINDSNTIAGSFIGQDDGIEHAFFGSLDGTYSTFDAGSGGTEARAINNNGYITGFSNSQNGTTADQPIFERRPNGNVKNVTVNGQPLFGRAQGINNAQNKFAGTFWDSGDHEAVAFVGRRDRLLHEVRIPIVHQASDGEGINSDNVVVGGFFQPPQQGFVVQGNSILVVFYVSDTDTGTVLEGINDNGQAVGQWVDEDGAVHSFLLDIATATFTDILVPGATNVRAWNLNSAGAVTVDSDVGPFIWCARKQDCPAGGTEVAAPTHVAPAGFPRYLCGRTCEVPAGRKE
jgi:hypothetical protein